MSRALMSIDDVCDKIDAVAEAHGWGGDYTCKSGKNWKMSSMGSRYCEITRCRDAIDEDGDEIQEGQRLRLRVSNHATAYCTEDMSVVVGGTPGGDDHTLEEVLAVLSGPWIINY